MINNYKKVNNKYMINNNGTKQLQKRGNVKYNIYSFQAL